MIQIFHNASCSKSNCALTILEESGAPFELINYLEVVPTVSELLSIIQKLGISAHDLVRKTEPVYLEKYHGKELSALEWVEAMVKDPILIERPIVVSGSCAVIARPAERIYEVLK